MDTPLPQDNPSRPFGPLWGPLKGSTGAAAWSSVPYVEITAAFGKGFSESRELPKSLFAHLQQRTSGVTSPMCRATYAAVRLCRSFISN